MKQLGVFLSLWLFCFPVLANDIVKIEYFFNSDPGYGSGTEITIPTADSIIDLDVILPIESLDYGFNTAYFRALDDSGKWSLTSYRVFTKMNTSIKDNNINRIEYFINTDPGYGLGTPITFTPAEDEISVDHTIDLTGLSNGFHFIYLRARDNRGAWSITSKRTFFVFENESNHAISRIEYFIDEDPGLGKGTALDFTEENGQVIIDHTLDINGLDNGFHKLYIRTKDASGAWSITSQRAFFVKDREYDDVLPNIVGLEYYIANEDTTTEIRKYQFLEPKPFIDTTDLIWLKDSLNLTFKERYNLYVRAVDEKGNKSSFATDQFIFYDSIPEGDIPMDMWIPFTVENDKPYKGNVYTGEIDNLFMFVKKADRHGYSGTWNGNIKLSKDEESLADYSSSPDFDKQLVRPEGGFYDFEITTQSQKSSGFIKFTEYPDTLQLNEWGKGEILRPYGYDWKCFDVTENTDTLFIQTEGYGKWSTIEVFYEDINQKDDYWYFSNMGAGYAISGFIVAPKKGRYYFRYKDSAVLYDNEEDDKSTQRRDYLVSIGYTNSQAIDKDEFKTITELSNYNFGPSLSTFSILGKGFTETDSIMLINNDSTGFYYCQVFYESSTSLQVQYDFALLDSGSYKVAVIGDTTIVHNITIKVENLIKENIQIEIISRDKHRVGRFQTYNVRLSNLGNSDLYNVATYISGIPLEAEVDLKFELDHYYSDTLNDSLDVVVELEDELMIPLIIGRIPTNGYVEIPFRIYIKETDTINLQVIANANFENEFEDIPIGDFEQYIRDLYELDSLFYSLDSLLNLTNLKSSGSLMTQIVSTYTKITDKMENMFDINIPANRCLSAVSNSIANTLGDKFWEEASGLVYDVFFKDWADCFSGIKTLAWDNLIVPYNSGKSSSQVFSQSELYKNIFKTTNSCAVAVLTTTPYGKVLNASFKASKTAYKASKFTYKATKNQMMKTNYARAIHEIKKANEIVNSADKIKKAAEDLRNIRDGKSSIANDCMPGIKNTLKDIFGVTSTTPEDKYGPVGHSIASELGEMEHFIDTNQVFEYRIDYWNKEDATAPAAIVYIRDTLDTDFDIGTLNFTEIGFLKWKVKLDGGDYFNVNVDCRPDMPYIVNVEGTVDPESREVYWVHTTLDPETMELPEDPLSGYLPPIDSTGYQIGWVDFTIEAKEGLPSGTVFENQARVNFDGVGKWGPAPPYGPYKNTFDAVKPISTVDELPNISTNDTITVNWSGSDIGSGIKQYTIYVAENDNNYSAWKQSTSDTADIFVGQDGYTYKFYSIAEDYVGNIENAKTDFEATTTFDLTSSIDENVLTNGGFDNVKVFPNPSQCCFTISFDVQKPVAYTLHVFNVTGTKILSRVVTQNDYQLDLSEFPKGIYGLSIFYENSVITKQLILE